MSIYEFRKNALEKIIIQFTEFKEKELVDIRVYYLADVARQEWKPSPKGISMSRGLLPELMRGIEKAMVGVTEDK